MPAVIAGVALLPAAASVPVHPPVAMQALALLELQVNTDVAPGATMLGLADNTAVGAGAVGAGAAGAGAGAAGTAATATVAATGALVPPAPVHASEYAAPDVSAPVDAVPFGANAPLQPPLAVHPVAFVDVHVSVAAVPLATKAGVAVNVAVGTATGSAFTATVVSAAALAPPAPVQTNEYVVAVVSTPVLCEPLVASGPLQPPEPMQDDALAELHVSVVVEPLSMVVDAALNVTDAGGVVAAGVVATCCGSVLASPTAPPQPDNNNETAPAANHRIFRMTSHDFFSSYVIASRRQTKTPSCATHYVNAVN